jgi:hypothetical protein
MHRRAQKAEGELARLKEAVRLAGEFGRDFNGSRHYYMMGYLLAHTTPARHIIEETDKCASKQ